MSELRPLADSKQPAGSRSLFAYVTAPAPRYMLRLSVLNGIFQRYRVRSGSRFLEIGPGLGDVSHYLLDRAGIASGACIDFSERAIQLLKERFASRPGLEILQGRLDQHALTDLDLICAFEVLEHVEDDIGFLNQCAARMKPGGLLILSVPAYQRKWQRQDSWAGHLRRYERKDLQQKLEAAGFELEELSDYGFPLMNLLVPAKEFYYARADRGNGRKSNEEKTKASGIDRAFFGARSRTASLWAYYPFMRIQEWFSHREYGDGIVAVARKSR